MECNSNCKTCASVCAKSCPICGIKGKKVSNVTVKSLIKGDFLFDKTQSAYICVNKKCSVVYYQENYPKYYNKEEVKVPIWFKEKYNQYIVCYCHQIYLNDIVELVQHIDEQNVTKKEVLKYLNKQEQEDCLHLNPLGECCDTLFQNAIAYAYKQKLEGKQ